VRGRKQGVRNGKEKCGFKRGVHTYSRYIIVKQRTFIYIEKKNFLKNKKKNSPSILIDSETERKIKKNRHMVSRGRHLSEN
jgi:hypothetical protein